MEEQYSASQDDTQQNSEQIFDDNSGSLNEADLFIQYTQSVHVEDPTGHVDRDSNPNSPNEADLFYENIVPTEESLSQTSNQLFPNLFEIEPQSPIQLDSNPDSPNEADLHELTDPVDEPEPGYSHSFDPWYTSPKVDNEFIRDEAFNEADFHNDSPSNDNISSDIHNDSFKTYDDNSYSNDSSW